MNLESVKAAGKDIGIALLSSDFPRIVAILENLEADFKPSTESIKSTGIGILVGKLRKSTNPQVSKTALRIINLWKTAVKGSGPVSGASTPIREAPIPASSTSASKLSTSSTPSSSAQASSSKPADPPTPEKKRTGKTDGVNFEITGDKTRNTCLSLIYDALISDATAPVEQVLDVSKKIERLTLEIQGKGQPANEYRNRMRSLVLNLGKINAELRYAVVEGRMRPEKLCNMSIVDMANKDRRNENLELEKQSIIDAQVAKPVESETDQFKCGKCNERRTSFYQMQTRSADEPMTTFVTCIVCRNKWKFS